MDRPLSVWARLMLRLALVLLAIGLLPALAVQYVLTSIDSPIPFLLLFLVTPLGGVALIISLILFLAAWLRR